MLSMILILLVAGIHLYFTYLEAFVWEDKRTRAIFGMSAELASQTKAMAANQGLYNAFLGVGLFVGLALGNSAMVVYLLLCVIVAGGVAALTGIPRALIFQTAPATLALLFWWAGF